MNPLASHLQRTLLAICTALLLAAPAPAANWQVLVVGDITRDTLPGDHPAWRRADRAITQELINQGFEVYDKDALQLLPRCRTDDCETADVAEHIKFARRTSADIDLVVTFSVTVTDRQGPAVSQWQLRLPGRMIDITTGAIVDQWAGAMMAFTDVSATCQDSCLRQWLADKAGDQGAELGSVLSTKLAAYVREYSYRLFLEAFTPKERDTLMLGLRQAPDYRSGGLTQTANTSSRDWLHTTVTSTWELRTPLGSGALRERMEQLAAQAGIPLRSRYNAGHFTLTREGMPYRGRYLGTLVAALLTALATLLVLRHRRLLGAFNALRTADQPAAGLAFTSNPRNALWPQPRQWQAAVGEWRQRCDTADAAAAAARKALEARQLEAAASALATALQANPELAPARELEAALPSLQLAAARAADARATLEADPARACSLFEEAAALDPALAGALAPELEQARAQLRDRVLGTYIEQARAALEAQRWYRAASQAGQGLASLGDQTAFATETATLQQLLEQALAQLPPLSGDARTRGGLPATHILVTEEVALGRSSGEQAGVIDFNYQRASRLGKQAILRRTRSGLEILDQGSTHGTLVEDALATERRPIALRDGSVISLGGGREPPRAGAVRLRCQLPIADSCVALLQLEVFHLRLLDQGELAAVWPSMTTDLTRRWLWLGDDIALYREGDTLQFGAPVGDVPGVLLGYQRGATPGYRLAPLGAPGDPQVTLAGEPLSVRVPWVEGAELVIAGHTLTLEAL